MTLDVNNLIINDSNFVPGFVTGFITGNITMQADSGLAISSLCQNTSIEENFNVDDFHIYPDPCNGHFSINPPTDFQEGILTVYNMNGIQVYRGNYERGLLGVNIEKFSKGLYLIELINSHSVISKKILIK
jgi:hypothetical protein